MEEKIFYSHKFPKISELKAGYNFVSFLLIIMLIGTTILSTKPMWEKLFFFPTGLLFVLILFRIMLINKFLIQRIEQVFAENLELSKKGKIYEALLQADANFAVLKKKERKLNYSLAFIPIPFVILSIIIEIKPIYKFYFMWIYILIGLSLSIAFSLQNIFKYFRKITEDCYQKIIDNTDCKDFYFKEESVIPNWIYYEKKWRKLLIFMGTIAVLFFTAHIFLIQYQRLLYLSLYLINYIILALIAFDVNKIAARYTTVLGNYDEYIKSKLGMSLKSPEVKTGYAVFREDMKKVKEGHESLWKEMNKNIKDIFK